jgi:hypothetical protein
MTFQVIAQAAAANAVAALLFALALRRGTRMPGFRPVLARRKQTRD